MSENGSSLCENRSSLYENGVTSTKDDALNLKSYTRSGVMKDAGFKGHGWIFPWVMLINPPLVMNAKWVLGADIVPPAKPARRLSAHVPSSNDNVGEISASFSQK